MRKLLGINYTAVGFNLSMLLLRIATGALMLPHGYEKLVKFSEFKRNFINFLGLGSTISLSLVIFAEFFCALFLVLGLFTRLSVIPLIITMAVAVLKAHNADFFGDGEHAALYLAAYIVLLLCGPGKISVDRLMNK
jgi:putative oxidoreductase